jgi:hypothetical protein
MEVGMSEQNIDSKFSPLITKWPSTFVSRDKVGEFSGGILHPRTLANLDCKGLGPRRFRVGRKVVYEVSELVRWLSERSSPIK